jgi:hypothetical protein
MPKPLPDRLLLYRKRQRFECQNIPIALSTLNRWAARAMDRLNILYNHLLDWTIEIGNNLVRY